MLISKKRYELEKIELLKSLDELSLRLDILERIIDVQSRLICKAHSGMSGAIGDLRKRLEQVSKR